jgi:hypothetical protein
MFTATMDMQFSRYGPAKNEFTRYPGTRQPPASCLSFGVSAASLSHRSVYFQK